MRKLRGIAFTTVALTAISGCSRLDEEEAAAQILEQVCSEWPYGCSDSTRVVVEDVRETRAGQQVEFRLVDRDDETPTLSAAYFEEADDGWDLLLFEGRFRQQLDDRANRFAEDRRRFTDHLMELKAAQKWYEAIYGRYAVSFDELDRVSYKRPGGALTMNGESDGSAWAAEISGPDMKCTLDTSRQLPDCSPQPPQGVGTKAGPLSRAFRE